MLCLVRLSETKVYYGRTTVALINLSQRNSGAPV